MFVDAFGTTLTKPKEGGIFFDFTGFPLANATIGDLKKYSFPDAADQKRIGSIVNRADYIRNNTDKYAMLGGSGYCLGLLQTFEFTMGFDEAFARLVLDEEFVSTCLDILMEKDILFWETYFRQWPENLDVIIYTDDFGGQEAPLLSLDMFKKYFKHRYERIFRTIYQYSPNTKILFHRVVQFTSL